MDYFQPDSLEAATAALAQKPWCLLAGGTDVFPALQGRPLTGPVLDLSNLRALRGIRQTDEAWHIGALTTWSDIIGTGLPPAFDALKHAGCEVGSVQIQNRATLAGNLCNASPAADGVPPLMILDAHVMLQSARGTRQMALEDFLLGNRKTVRAADELLTEIVIPRRAALGRSTFLKLGARRYLVISIAMVAARIVVNDGKITDCAIAVGACSAVAKRLRRLEQSLIGRDIGNLASLDPALLDGLSPIDDVRAPAAYRLEAVAELIARALAGAAS